MTNENKNFIKEDPGMGKGAIILLILAVIIVFGGLAYFLMTQGDTLALPKVPK